MSFKRYLLAVQTKMLLNEFDRAFAALLREKK